MNTTPTTRVRGRVLTVSDAAGRAGTRRAVLAYLVERVPPPAATGCTRVGIDGPDGAGKTRFADDLADALELAGRHVVRVSADDFHHLRAIRHRRRSASPEGFWLDSHDYVRLRAYVLDPLGPFGDRRYRDRSHDLETDERLAPAWKSAPPGAVLVLDGLFLHRDELARCWDLSVFLEVPFTETARRMAVRDGTHPDPDHPSMRRYVGGQRLYYRACTPHERASVVVDNTNPTAPRLLRG
jgi:uridine kinase